MTDLPLRLPFSHRVLGKLATARLLAKETTQTIRGEQFINETRGLSSGHQIDISLDGNIVGNATLQSITRCYDPDEDDAKLGGFNNLAELLIALKRAGFRFRPIESYQLFRILFKWQGDKNVR